MIEKANDKLLKTKLKNKTLSLYTGNFEAQSKKNQIS